MILGLTSESVSYLYTLTDPTTGEIFYVGQSSRPYARLHTHIRDAERGFQDAKALRIALILAAGHKPTITIERCLPGDGRALKAEKQRIQDLWAQGAPVVNAKGLFLKAMKPSCGFFTP